MPAAFQLSAQVVLVGPTNIAQFTANLNRQLGSALGITTGKTNQLNTALSKTTTHLSQSTKASQGFAHGILLAGSRYAKFVLATGGAIAALRGLRAGFADALSLQNSLVKLAQIGGTSLQSMTGFATELRKVSSEFGVAGNEIGEAAITLKQAGFSIEAVKGLLPLLAKAKLSPTINDLNDVSNAIILLGNYGQKGADEFEQSLSAINTLAGKFPVEAQDLITGLKKAGGTFLNVGGDVNELLALMTALRSSTRESADTLGTFLRVVPQRLQRPSAIKGLRDVLGVDLLTPEGGFKGVLKSIQELQKAKERATSPAQSLLFTQTIEKLIGGGRGGQTSRLLSLIQNVSLAQNAYNVAQQQSNSLTRDAATAQSALQQQVARVKEEFFAIFDELLVSDKMKSLAASTLDAARGAMEFARSISGVVDAFTSLLPLLIASGFVGGKFFGGRFGKGFASVAPPIPTFGGKTGFTQRGVVRGLHTRMWKSYSSNIGLGHHRSFDVLGGNMIPTTIPLQQFSLKRGLKGIVGRSASKIGRFGRGSIAGIRNLGPAGAISGAVLAQVISQQFPSSAIAKGIGDAVTTGLLVGMVNPIAGAVVGVIAGLNSFTKATLDAEQALRTKRAQTAVETLLGTGGKTEDFIGSLIQQFKQLKFQQNALFGTDSGGLKAGTAPNLGVMDQIFAQFRATLSGQSVEQLLVDEYKVAMRQLKDDFKKATPELEKRLNALSEAGKQNTDEFKTLNEIILFLNPNFQRLQKSVEELDQEIEAVKVQDFIDAIETATKTLPRFKGGALAGGSPGVTPITISGARAYQFQTSVAPSLKMTEDEFENFHKALQSFADSVVKQTEELISVMEKEIDLRQEVVGAIGTQADLFTAREQFNLQRRGLRGRFFEGEAGPTIVDIERGLRRQQGVLGLGNQGLNPAAIGQTLINIQNQLRQSLISREALQPGTPAYNQATAQILNFQQAIENARKGLSNLTDVSEHLSVIQKKLGEIEDQRQTRLQFGREFFGAKPQERRNMIQDILIAQGAAAMNPRDIANLAVSVQNRISEALENLSKFTIPGTGGLSGADIANRQAKAFGLGIAPDQEQKRQALLNQQDALMQRAVDAQDQLVRSLQESQRQFADSVRRFGEAVTGRAGQFGVGLANPERFPLSANINHSGQIELAANHKVEVVINGLEVLAQLKPEFQSLIVSETQKALRKHINFTGETNEVFQIG